MKKSREIIFWGVLVDATFGCGRHTKALKKRFPDLGVIALDIDSCGFERSKGLRHRYSNPPSFTFVQANWSNLSLAVNKAGQKFFDTPVIMNHFIPNSVN